MYWYLVHTKPKQEKRALENLERQGYQCYLPTIHSEKLSNKSLSLSTEPLFPRYLFIRLGVEADCKSWIPIRSTKGVNRLVTFGLEPAKVADCLVDNLRQHERFYQDNPIRLFDTGAHILVTDGPFSGIEGIFQISDGERRVIVLIEMLSKPVRIAVSPAAVRKIS